MRYFEDIHVGDVSHFDEAYTFTEKEIVEFAQRWDPQPFHIDKAAAAESIFGGLVACSSHIIAAALSFGTRSDPVAAVSALGFSNMRTLLPVRPGDQLKMSEEVIEARLSNSHKNCGILTMSCEIFNQNKEKVFIYETAFIARCRPSED